MSKVFLIWAGFLLVVLVAAGIIMAVTVTSQPKAKTYKLCLIHETRTDHSNENVDRAIKVCCRQFSGEVMCND